MIAQEARDSSSWNAGRCETCGRSHYPFRTRCPYCWHGRVVERRLTSPGRLETFSIVRRAVNEHSLPYVVGWAGFPSEGVRVFGPIHSSFLNHLSVGAAVVLDPKAGDSEWPFMLRPSARQG